MNKYFTPNYSLKRKFKNTNNRIHIVNVDYMLISYFPANTMISDKNFQLIINNFVIDKTDKQLDLILKSLRNKTLV